LKKINKSVVEQVLTLLFFTAAMFYLLITDTSSVGGLVELSFTVLQTNYNIVCRPFDATTAFKVYYKWMY
jgi:hypothetical protein